MTLHRLQGPLDEWSQKASDCQEEAGQKKEIKHEPRVIGKCTNAFLCFVHRSEGQMNE